jgi:prepilin-type N-terminal cleavage/methylation domain-containing protein
VHEQFRPGGENGFGLIEIVVSMFILAIIAMAILPVLAMGMKQSQTNAVYGAATELVNQELEDARANPNCGASAVTTTSTVTSPQGVLLDVSRTTGACPATGSAPSVTVSATATRDDTGVTLATASTLVFIAQPGS